MFRITGHRGFPGIDGAKGELGTTGDKGSVGGMGPIGAPGPVVSMIQGHINTNNFSLMQFRIFKHVFLHFSMFPKT